MRSEFMALSVFLIVALLSPAYAEVDNDDDDGTAMQSLVEELFLSELPFLQEQGETQLSLATGYQSLTQGSASHATLAVEYGITSLVQIGLEAPFHVIDGGDEGETQSGLGDAEFGLLVGIVRSPQFMLSASGEVLLPVGSSSVAEGEFEWGPGLLAAWDLQGLQLIGGIGAEFADEESAVETSAAVVFPMGDIVTVLEWTRTNSDEGGHYVTLGLIAEVHEDIEASIGVPLGLDDESPDWGLRFALTTEF